VDIADLNTVLVNFDKSGTTWSQGDFDGNGTVTVEDLNKVLTNYDKHVGGGGRRHDGGAPSRRALGCSSASPSSAW